MLHLILGSLGTFMSFFGIFTNLYVLVVLLLSKKARSSSEWILLHLSSCGFAASLTNLLCVSPSVFLEKWIAAAASGCNVVGAGILTLQLLIVWSICALSVDRCAAIVSPLRYTQVVTRRKIAVFFITVWITSMGIVLASFFTKSPTTPEDNSSSFFVTRIVPIPDEEENLIPQASSHSTPYISIPTTANMMIEVERNGVESRNERDFLGDIVNISYDSAVHNENDLRLGNSSTSSFEYSDMMGVCLPKMYGLSVFGVFWMSVWIIFILVGPLITLLICDFTVLSIARKQRHRIIMALYQITAVTQVTVTGSKGTALPGLWLNRSVPAKSRACRAVWEDMITLIILHLPLILIFMLESLLDGHKSPKALLFIASLSLFATPSLTAVLYGIRARPLRAAYKSYLRKRLTNTTLQHEIQQRLSPVDGSPRLSGSRLKSFRSSSPSPNSSPIQTPRRLSTNDLRPPPIHLTMTISPSHDNLGRNHVGNHFDKGFNSDTGSNKRKIRSFLHIPSQIDMQEFWSGLRRPNRSPNDYIRSPTIVITHEIRSRESLSSSNSLSASPSPAAEQRL